MGHLDRLKDHDVLNDRYLEQYRRDSGVLRDELVYLHSNLRLLSQLRQFPVSLFEAPQALFWFLIKNLTTECALICCRVWKDKPKRALTLNRLAKWLTERAIRPQYRDELTARLESARVPDSVESTIDSLRSVRHASIAHLDYQGIGALKSSPQPVSFQELRAAGEALGAFFNALSFGSQQLFVVVQFYSQDDAWFEGDLGYVLDRIALGSSWFTAPEKHPAFWRVLRQRLDAEQLREINGVRTRHGLPPLG